MKYVFGDYELDSSTYEFRQCGELVNVEKQVFDLLLLLVASPERIVTKDEIIENVWGGRIISDSAINSRVSAVRSAIGDSGREQRLIKTIHNQGFRFVADVSAIAPAPSTPIEDNAHTSPSALATKLEEDTHFEPSSPPKKRRWLGPFLGGIVAGGALVSLTTLLSPNIDPINIDSYSPWQQNLPTESYLARDAYLRGIELRKKSNSTALRFAADQFQIAIDNDPNFAASYAGLASVNADIYANDPSANILLKANINQTLSEAKALSPNSKEVRLAEGEIAALRQNYGQAILLADQILEEDEHYLPAYILKSEGLYQTGRAQEAIEALGVAISMAPLSPVILQAMSEAKLAVGDYEGSLEAANANVWWNPDNVNSLLAMANVQYNKAQYENAFYYLQRAKALNPLESTTGYDLMRLYTDLGMPVQRDSVARTNVQEALVQAMNGDKEEAWALLSNLDLEDMHINMHYFMREYDYAVQHYNIYLANRSEGSIQPGQGLHYARMSHVFERTQTPIKDRINAELAQYYADKSPADFALYEDVLGGSAFYLMNDEPENALLWLDFLVEKEHTFMSLTNEPIFGVLETLPGFDPIRLKMAATAKVYQTGIIEKLSD